MSLAVWEEDIDQYALVPPQQDQTLPCTVMEVLLCSLSTSIRIDARLRTATR